MTEQQDFKKILAFFIYGLATLFLIYEMALQVSPSVMTHQLMAAYKIDAKTLGIVASFYFYSYTLMQIPSGYLYDRFGPRVLISLAAFVCAAGSLFFGFTRELYLAALGRFFMGIGSSFAFIGVLVVATRWFPPYCFAFLVGVAQFLAAMGALGGELPLAVLVNHYGWRTVMVLAGVLGLVIALFCAMIIRDRPYSHLRPPKEPHHHVWKELKEIFHSRQTWWIAFYAFSSWGPIAVFAALWGVPFMMIKYNITNTKAALAIAMVWLGLAFMSPFLGWFSDRLGRRCILLTSTSLLGLIGSLVAIYLPGVPFWLACIFLFIMGVAASGQILTFALVKDNNRHSRIATAIGLNNMAVVLGGALFQPFVGYILHLFWSGLKTQGVPVYSIENYHLGLVVVPICFALGAIVSLFFIRETYCRSHYDDYSDYVH